MAVDVVQRTAGVAPASTSRPPVAMRDGLRHPEDELAWVVLGTAVADTPGHRHQLDAGTALWIPAGTWHQVTATPGSLLVPVWFAPTAAGALEARPCRVDDVLQDLLARTLQARVAHQEEEAFLLGAVRDAVPARLAGHSGLPVPRDGAAAVVAAGLLADPGDRRPVAEHARGAHVSVRTLQRAFLADTGMSLQQWRIVARCEAGRQLVADGASVADAAARLGYRSVPTFIRAYATVYGRTPAAHARELHR